MQFNIAYFSFNSLLWAAGRAFDLQKLSSVMLAWLCLGQGADLHMAQLMPLPLITVSLAPVYLDWFYFPGFTFLVPAHPGSPRQNQREP